MAGLGQRNWSVWVLLAACVGSVLWMIRDDRGPSRAGDVMSDPAGDAAGPRLSNAPFLVDSSPDSVTSVREVVKDDRAVQIVGNTETTSAAEELLGDSYEREAGLYLDSFMGDEPDIVGWTIVWQRLASDAVLAEESIYEQDGSLFGEFRVEEEGITVGFEIGGDGYTLKWKDEASTFSEGGVDFNSSISFADPVNGQLGKMHGVVQFLPREDQVFHREGPVGYIFNTSETSTNATPMTAVFNANGTYGLSILPMDENDASEGGFLDPAYAWYLKLKDIK